MGRAVQTTSLRTEDVTGRLVAKTPCCSFDVKLSPSIRFTFKSCRGCDTVYNVTVYLETDKVEWEQRAVPTFP